MELTIKKKLFVWITIPCIDHVGSCTYPDICSQSNASSCPPAFKKYGIPCSCPIKPVSISQVSSVTGISLKHVSDHCSCQKMYCRLQGDSFTKMYTGWYVIYLYLACFTKDYNFFNG